VINNLTTRVDAAIEALEKGATDSMSVRRRIIVILRDLQAALSPSHLPSEEEYKEVCQIAEGYGNALRAILLRAGAMGWGPDHEIVALVIAAILPRIEEETR